MRRVLKEAPSSLDISSRHTVDIPKPRLVLRFGHYRGTVMSVD